MRPYRMAVVGYPLLHTFSPGYFKEKFLRECLPHLHYHKLAIAQLNSLKDAMGHIEKWIGFNVTVPHKQNIIPFCASLTPVAQAVAAVNCVAVTEGNFIGHNTDVAGFQQSLQPLLPKYFVNALVLGNGGAAQAVKYVLQQLEIPFISVVRKNKLPHQLLYEELNEDIISEHLLIINTTPLGMAPFENDGPAISYTSVSAQHILYDLVYQQKPTPFLQQGLQAGAVVKDGLEMLHLQAEASWQFWNVYHNIS